MDRDDFIDIMQAQNKDDLEIVKAKNQDYADSADPLQNFRMVEDAGFLSMEEGIVVRLSDKLQRIFNLVGREDGAVVADESLFDTISDARNYLRILEIALRQKEIESERGSYRQTFK
jgi:hypothetical protein